MLKNCQYPDCATLGKEIVVNKPSENFRVEIFACKEHLKSLLAEALNKALKEKTL